MRRILHDQLHLVPTVIAHVHARELVQMNVVLEQLAGVVELVHADLVRQPRRPRSAACTSRAQMRC